MYACFDINGPCFDIYHDILLHQDIMTNILCNTTGRYLMCSLDSYIKSNSIVLNIIEGKDKSVTLLVIKIDAEN